MYYVKYFSADFNHMLLGVDGSDKTDREDEWNN